MVVKYTGTIDSVRLANNGNVQIQMSAPYCEIASIVSILQLMNKAFSMILVDGDKNYKVKNVIFNGLRIDKDGESKIKFDMESEDMKNLDFVVLGNMKGKNILTALKADEDEV